MTLKEIAKEAGVSVSTVSRVVNSRNDSFASKEVRDRIWAIVKKSGYLPNKSARELQQGKKSGETVRSGSLCCILGRTDTMEENPFLSQLSRVIEKQAMEHGYPVRFSYSIFDVNEKLMTNVIREKIESFKPAGAIAIGQFNKCAIDLLNRYYANIVYAGRGRINAEWDQVICDAYEAAEIALSHLYLQGHRRIGYLGGTESEVRFLAYQNFLRKHDLAFEDELVYPCEHNGEGGVLGAEKLIKADGSKPTAVLCASDTSAIALMNRLKDAKIQVPEQVSVVGIDNIELSGYVSPMLTTMGAPVQEIGNVAVQTLIGRIERRHKKPLRIYLQNEFIHRQSVAVLANAF
ncbi:transcriptional regulator, LacI family [Syntrophobotulus glycolicus DSM 8271]|uniref:Transcriptional regulator, LacI family n=1 Tax=Syntrophobotulus glycolicus (strain DSM 8271 / FlGlyR) TaxID=645991 RepID=F0SW30_SYNGF|nr:LacI family DNA-binding transcriptional regulator [Syntrophobotulus glycolicus]ADY56814.1 transcriptional regulator, LacI family [Syntrophobotulus glycolicus DSM 8271]